MKDTHFPGSDFVIHPAEHPSDWTLELLAEGELPPGQQAEVAAHVEDCARCASELEGYRALFVALSGLPRFEPSIDFGAAVMARVRIAPVADPLFARFVRWLPATRRGWILLLLACMAPALPVIALVAWLVSQPLFAPSALIEWGGVWMRDTGWSLLTRTLVAVMESSVLAWGNALVERLLEMPVEILAGGALLLAVGIPLSAWTLYRLLRTPVGGTVYAH
jgi:anti-sigma factor RsiW